MGYYARGDGFFKFKAAKEKEEEITQLIEEIYDICETSYENGTMYFGVSCDDKYFDDYVKEILEKLTIYIIVNGSSGGITIILKKNMALLYFAEITSIMFGEQILTLLKPKCYLNGP